MTYTRSPWSAVLANDPRGQPQIFYKGIVAVVSMTPEQHLTVVADCGYSDADEWEGNTLLIAAAPKMLEAIRRVLKDGVPWHPDGCTWCVRCELEEAIKGLPEARP